MILELVRRLQITHPTNQPTNQPKEKEKTKKFSQVCRQEYCFVTDVKDSIRKRIQCGYRFGVVANRDDRTTRPAQSRAFDPARTFEAGAGAVAGDVGTPAAAAAELEL